MVRDKVCDMDFRSQEDLSLDRTSITPQYTPYSTDEQ